MRSRPRERLPFCFEKPIDHHRVALVNSPARFSRCRSVPHRRAGVNRGQPCAVRKNNTAAVGNVARVDRAMPVAETQTGRAFVLPCVRIGSFAAASPINGHSSQKRLLARKSDRRHKKNCNRYSDEPSHNYRLTQRSGSRCLLIGEINLAAITSFINSECNREMVPLWADIFLSPNYLCITRQKTLPTIRSRNHRRVI